MRINPVAGWLITSVIAFIICFSQEGYNDTFIPLFVGTTVAWVLYAKYRNTVSPKLTTTLTAPGQELTLPPRNVSLAV